MKRVKEGWQRQARCAAALIGASVLLALGACSGSRSTAEERRLRAVEGSDDVVVAVVWPWEARKDMLYSEGLDLALAEVNDAGGVHGRSLRLLRKDDQESVNQGRLIAQKIADDPDVVAVIGHLQSYVTVPAAAIYDAAGLVLLAPAATSAELTSKGYRRVFRLTVNDLAIGQQMADYAAAQGYRRIAVYYERSIYGRALANAFEEQLSTSEASVLARNSYDVGFHPREGALQPMLTRWRSLDLDAIFLAGQTPPAGQLVAVFRKRGFALPVLGGDAMSSPDFIKAGGDSVEGTVVATFFHPEEPRPEVQEFVAAFRKRYGVDPDASSALGYDAVRLLAHAMNQAASPAPAEVAKVLHDEAGWDGVTGNFKFDQKGELVGRHVIKGVVKNGRLEYLGK